MKSCPQGWIPSLVHRGAGIMEQVGLRLCLHTLIIASQDNSHLIHFLCICSLVRYCPQISTDWGYLSWFQYSFICMLLLTVMFFLPFQIDLPSGVKVHRGILWKITHLKRTYEDNFSSFGVSALMSPYQHYCNNVIIKFNLKLTFHLSLSRLPCISSYWVTIHTQT